MLTLQISKFIVPPNPDYSYIDTLGDLVNGEKEQERQERGYLDNTGTLKVYIDRDGS